MQTVNFQCGHCGNLMAVTADLVGQQVRCPHCQQVVLAPAPAGPQPEALAPAPQPPSEPAFPAAEEKESIFAPSEHISEDVFGHVPRPTLEMPARPVLPAVPPPLAPVSAEPRDLLPPAPPPVSSTSPEAANPFVNLASAFQTPPSPTNLETSPASESSPWSAPREDSHWHDPGSAAGQAEPHPDFDSAGPPRVRTPRADGGWWIVAFIIPLVSYSILVTILAVIFYIRQATQLHPLEVLPDLEGDNKGARRVGMVQRWSPDTVLPDKLKVALGQSIRIGDLEVTPLRVERGHIQLRYPDGRREEPQRDESLVLHLHLRNVSENVAFKPTDPEFLRAWDEQKRSGAMPYTYLEAGHMRFFGGPIPWRAAKAPGQRADWYVEGHNHDRELQPGEAMSSLVCTNPDRQAVRELRDYKGPMLWRVQVRRGLVQVKDREVSATAVIGVEFTSAEIQPSRG